MCIRMNVCMHVRACVCMFVCTLFVHYIGVCMLVYIYIYIFIYFS